MTSPWRGFIAGCILILAGAVLAHLIQTSGGISIEDIRFEDSNGNTLSALLYVPANASAADPAPAILAVHGYINSREAQSGFAIEFARRGYVVLALDQRGHGYSDAPAFADGFGGPAALAYLRSLDIVDSANIGLEGHSMGGWTVLAAASAMPDGYRSLVLEGSTTGPPFAADGSTRWPRNLAVVFSEFDEFAQLMWGVTRAKDLAASPKLMTLFGTDAAVVPGQVYGDIGAGTARILWQPPVTHPGDHISHQAIGHALDWFARTLDGGATLPERDQIWFYKELGTLLALIGLVVLIAGSFQLLMQNSYLGQVRVTNNTTAFGRRNLRWWVLAIISTALPVATYYPLFSLADGLLPASAWLPQSITTAIMCWALANGLIAAAIGRIAGGGSRAPLSPIVPSLMMALAVVGIAYVVVIVIDLIFTIDFRFWFVGLKALSLTQFKIALIYLLPFTLYFLLALRALHLGMSVDADSAARAYVANAFILTGGFALFLLAQYLNLFITGMLLTPDEPLNTIVMIQFVPLLLIVSVISTFCYRRCGSYLPGALINALFVTWYIVAGQATQYPFN